MKWIRLFEEFNTSLNDLVNLLTKYNIPVHLWGKGKSKSVEHLLDEIDNNECSVVEENNGLTRYIEFVAIKIYFKNDSGENWTLVEDKQVFKDGRIRRRNMPNSVSEKMKFGEDAEIAAVRGIEEELGVIIEKDQLIKRREIDYNGGSLSYPGLETKYKGHKFICYFNINQFNESGYVENQKDKSTYFIWKKLN
jgi:hypothetical protein